MKNQKRKCHVLAQIHRKQRVKRGKAIRDMKRISAMLARSRSLGFRTDHPALRKGGEPTEGNPILTDGGFAGDRVVSLERLREMRGDGE